MKQVLRILVCLGIAFPAVAQSSPQELSPVQQYLYSDTGYAPGYYAAPAQPAPVEPYDTAYAPAEPETDDGYYQNRSHLNDGVRGMNLY